jgi:hypothetical protein
MEWRKPTIEHGRRSAARGGSSAIALIAALFVGSASAVAAPILDQSSDFQSGFTQFDLLPRAQGFTVGLNGTLEAVELFASQTNPNGNLVVSVHESAAGFPPMPTTAVPLSSGTIPLSALPSSAAGGAGPAFVWIDLVPPVTVLAGERLVLVVQADAGGAAAGRLVWFGNPGSYAGGEAFRFDPGGLVICTQGPPCVPGDVPPSWKRQNEPAVFDFAFRTYLPEPTLGPMIAGAVAAIASSRRGEAHRHR